MIVTEKKPFEEILLLLSEYKKIFIIGCGDCAETCKTGGEDEVQAIAGELIKYGKDVSGHIVPKVTCAMLQTKQELRSYMDAINTSDAVLSLSCGAGTQSLSLIFSKPVLPGLNTKFLGTIKRAGDFVQYCMQCGDCVLGLTGGLCPLTRCAKSLMNGPCSGSFDGKCETNHDKDCAWHMIYHRLKDLGNLEVFEEKIRMKDHSKHLPQQEKKVLLKG